MEPAGRLIGREEECAALERAVTTVAGGAARVVVVQGEPGIGKTRLLAELAEAAEARGFLALEGRAAEFELDLPFGVFVDALDGALGTSSRARIDLLGERLLAELAAMFPALGGHGVVPDRPAAERYQAHRAVRALLEQLAHERPLLLVLDDLQWADPASTELVGHLLRRPPGAPVLLAFAARLAHGVTALDAAVERAVREGAAARLALAPLAPAEAARLVGEPPGSQRARALLRLTGGNPFYLQELARAQVPMPEDDSPEPGPGIPEAVLAAVRAELVALPPQERAVAVAAAVAGESFDADLAAAAGGTPEEVTHRALDALVRRDVLRATAVPGRLRFRHPIVRHVAYGTARAGWRRAAHGRVAAALRARGHDAAVFAHHVERSAKPGDSDAVEVLCAAAAATAPHAPASAAEWLRSALQIAGDTEPAVRMRILVPLAEALRAAGRLHEARDALSALLEALGPQPSPVRARLVAGVADVYQQLEQQDAGRALLTAELGGASAGSREAIILRLGLANDALVRGDYAGMAAHAAAAIADARDAGDPLLAGRAHGVAAVAEYHVESIPAAHEHLDAVAPQADAAEADPGQPDAELLAWAAWAAMLVERHADAARWFGRGLRLARASGQTSVLRSLLAGAALNACAKGAVTSAREAAEGALEAAIATGGSPWLAAGAAAQAAVLAGAPQEAQRLADGGRVRDDARGLLVNLYAAEADLALGAPAGAVARLLRVAGGPDLPRLERALRPAAYELLCRAEIARGSLEAAGRWASAAEALGARSPLAGRRALAARARAAVLLAQGDGPGAVALAEAAATGFDSIGAQLEAAAARLLAGRAHAVAGARDAAVSALAAAEAAAAACGSGPLQDQACRARRRIKGAVPLAQGAPLSSREREVAALVGKGRTNREIGEALFISPRTVEDHLKRIFVKLGARSRAEVAAQIGAGDPG